MRSSAIDPVVHFELPYHDARRIAAFYAAAFGWETQALGADADSYVLATTAATDVKPGAPAGAINGGFCPSRLDQPAQYPSVVIAVRDIRESMRKVAEAGGEVFGEPTEIPGVGQYASFFDTERKRISLLQPVPRM